MLHHALTGNDLHRVHRWEFEDSAARSATGEYAESDVGKVCLQTDTNAFYALFSVASPGPTATPTWGKLGFGLIIGDIPGLQDELDSKADAAATTAALAGKQNSLGFTPENSANKGSAGGYASLDGSGKLPASQLPDNAIVDFLGSVASQSAMLALTGEKGDWCSRSDVGKVYVITGSDPTNLSSWTALTYPTGGAPASHASTHAPGDSDPIDWLGKINMRGVIASRPAAGPGNAGCFYLATDENGGTLYHSNGSSWVQVAAAVSAGGGGTTEYQQDGSTASTRAKANLLTLNGYRLKVTDDSANSAAKLSIEDLTWKPTIFTVPLSGSLTGRNTGSGLTATDRDTGLHLNFTPGTTGKIRGYESAVSGSRCEVWMRRVFYGSGFGGGFSRAFLYARSSGGAFYTIGLNTSGNLIVESWSNDSGGSVSGTGTSITGVEFSRIGVRFSGFSGTMSAEWSLDGQVWITLASGLSFTPTTCGVGLWCNELIDAVFHSFAFA